jgi:hypothetical protein
MRFAQKGKGSKSVEVPGRAFSHGSESRSIKRRAVGFHVHHPQINYRPQRMRDYEPDEDVSSEEDERPGAVHMSRTLAALRG